MALALDPRYIVEIQPRRSSTSSSISISSISNSSMAPTRHLSHDVYLRRRLVVGLAVFGVVVAACLGFRTLASRGDETASIPTVTPLSASAQPLSTTVNGVDVSLAFAQGDGFYIVQSGDTLWSIASSLTSGNIRNYVHSLIELNGGASIDVGQRLIVPSS
jgi:LysM repeat protein